MRPLQYIGYGGTGEQVRDGLHVDDPVDLIERQLVERRHWDRRTFNVGGGCHVSLWLRETCDICRDITGHDVPVVAAGPITPAMCGSISRTAPRY
jgi:CDP-paratose 2-epimerase